MKEKLKNICRIKKFTLTGRIKPTDVPEEGNLFLEVDTTSGKLNLECFIYNKEPYDLHLGNLKVNDLVIIEFVLSSDIETTMKMNYAYKKIIRDPNIKFNPIRGKIDYVATGEILKIHPHFDSEMAKVCVRIILDCGIYISTNAPNTLSLKVGDYVQLEGRLDAHIISKVGSLKKDDALTK